ncbi:MAG: GYD domain-containing protein [Candidatus Methylomirabilaceae bacterium]
MPTYVTLVNWTDQGIRTVKDSPKRLDAFKQMLKNAGGELRGFYLTLGAYDLVAILEAPSDDVVAKLVLSVASQGNVRTTTLKAFPEDEARKIIGSVA